MKKRQVLHKIKTERAQYEKLKRRYLTQVFITDDMWPKIRREFSNSVDEKIFEVYRDKELTKSQLNRLYKKCVNRAYSIRFRSSDKCAFLKGEKILKGLDRNCLLNSEFLRRCKWLITSG